MNLNKFNLKMPACLTQCAFGAMICPFLHTMLKQNPDSLHGNKNLPKLYSGFKKFEIRRKTEGRFSQHCPGCQNF
jgi:hypothetical protein